MINNEHLKEEIDGTLRITKKGMKYVLEESQRLKVANYQSQIIIKIRIIKEKYPNAYEHWTSEADEK